MKKFLAVIVNVFTGIPLLKTHIAATMQGGHGKIDVFPDGWGLV